MSNDRPLGPVMFDLQGTTLTAAEAELLRHPQAGGIIFFTRNYESPEQIAALCQAIRAVRADLLISVDHEGGRVQRFRSGFTRLPPAAAFAGYASEQDGDAVTLAETAGWLMAVELRAVGIDFSFAPVLDVDCGISEIIGNRAFGTDPDAVGRLAGAFAAGMKRAGMATVGKHFPGHGAVAADSHLALPIDPRPFAEIEQRDLPPFRALIAEGLDGIMPAHVVYPEVDPQPAGFSRHWIETVLRVRLGFDGAVFSDDLSMEGAAIAGDYSDRAAAALDAGCDMLLVCNHPEAIEPVLDAASRHTGPRRPDRLKRMAGQGLALHAAELQQSLQWQTAAEMVCAISRYAGLEA